MWFFLFASVVSIKPVFTFFVILSGADPSTFDMAAPKIKSKFTHPTWTVHVCTP